MDTYLNTLKELQEAYAQTLFELSLLKVSKQNADKALERRLQAEATELQEQLDELELLKENLTYELDLSKAVTSD